MLSLLRSEKSKENISPPKDSEHQFKPTVLDGVQYETVSDLVESPLFQKINKVWWQSHTTFKEIGEDIKISNPELYALIDNNWGVFREILDKPEAKQNWDSFKIVYKNSENKHHIEEDNVGFSKGFEDIKKNQNNKKCEEMNDKQNKVIKDEKIINDE